MNTQAAPLSEQDIDAWRQRIRASTFSNYHNQMGRSFWREGAHAAAEAAFFKSWEMDGERYEALQHLLDLYRQSGRDDKAEQLLQEAWRRDPDSEKLAKAVAAVDVVEDSIENAMSLLKAGVSASGRFADRLAPVVLKVIQFLLNQKRPVDALELFALLPREYYLRSDIQFEKGLSLQACGRFKEAASMFSSVLEREPGEDKATRHLALIDMYNFQYDEAFARFELLRNAGSIEGAVYQAVCRLLSGRASEAETLLDAIPQMENFHLPLVYRCLARFRLGRLEEAQRDLDSAFSIHPDHWLGWTVRGVVDLHLGSPTAAAKSFAQGVPGNVLPLRLGLAAAALAMGKAPDDPRSDIEKADIQHYFFALFGPEGEALRQRLGVVTPGPIPTTWS